MENLLSEQIIANIISERMSPFKDAQTNRPKRDHLCILIVEDQASSCLLLSKILHDYQVDIANTVKQGLEVYLEKAPDIAFIDIRLSDGSGHILARHIKEIDPESYVVMATGNNYVEDVTEAKNNRVDGYTLKPYSSPKILDCVKKYFETRRQAAPK